MHIEQSSIELFCTNVGNISRRDNSVRLLARDIRLIVNVAYCLCHVRPSEFHRAASDGVLYCKITNISSDGDVKLLLARRADGTEDRQWMHNVTLQRLRVMLLRSTSSPTLTAWYYFNWKEFFYGDLISPATIKCSWFFMWSARYIFFFRILRKFGIPWQFFIKVVSNKVHVNPWSRNRPGTCGPVDGRTDGRKRWKQ